MDSNDGFMKQNQTFQALAKQFGFHPVDGEVKEKGDSFGETLLLITTCQLHVI